MCSNLLTVIRACNVKNVTFELGGKSAALVFADADIANAVGS